jgi:hypothetical protein
MISLNLLAAQIVLWRWAMPMLPEALEQSLKALKLLLRTQVSAKSARPV